MGAGAVEDSFRGPRLGPRSWATPLPRASAPPRPRRLPRPAGAGAQGVQVSEGVSVLGETDMVSNIKLD